MDFDNGDEGTWCWQDIDCALAEEPRYEISPWTDDTTNHVDMSYIINDTTTTPVKACIDTQWKVSSEDLMKEYEETRVSSSQAKRRRVLKFNDEPIDFPFCTEELSSDYLKTKEREESLESLSPEVLQWNGTSSDFAPALDFEMTEPDQWLAEVLNDTDINCEDMNATSNFASDIQFSSPDFCEILPNQETPIQICEPPAPKPAPKTLSGKVIFKGRTSYIKTPIKLASSVAYPFTFIKPCPEKGGMTLQDINRKIHAPPKKPNPPPNLPKSAISGKPVVGKTRICTGGKGSITITRTRG